MSTFAERLVEDFGDKEFAHGYMEDHGNAVIAAQIKALREQRGLTQAQLAQLAGMKQERICALENVDYDAWTVKTLRKLAEAFDVHLKVAFVPFSTGILDVVNLNRDRLEVASRTEDLASCGKHRIVIDVKGDWKMLDPSHLCTVQPLPTRGPVGAQFGEWQSVTQAYEPAKNIQAQL